MKLLKLALPLAALLMAACQKNLQTNDAVKAGVIKHLSTNAGLNVTAMDVSVTAVTFKDNEAQATVSFKPKGGDAAAGMQMTYTLEKQGAEWVVKKKPDAGSHTGGMQGGMPGGMPAATPPAGGANPHGGMVMPNSGMPQSGAPQGTLPADHPPVGTSKAPEKK
ncbi:MAG: hypothetical protein HY858_10995 [Candidatus Solibacter usitatus]|nr:hypothetical protein [Candidatus Solibacter usitatus]